MGNKTDYIRFRVDGDIKRKLMEILELKGDTMSGFLTHTIVEFIQKETKQERK